MKECMRCKRKFPTRYWMEYTLNDPNHSWTIIVCSLCWDALMPTFTSGRGTLNKFTTEHGTMDLQMSIWE